MATRIPKQFKAVKRLCERVIKHRQKCEGWKNGNPCFDCHYGKITSIEKELIEIEIK